MSEAAEVTLALRKVRVSFRRSLDRQHTALPCGRPLSLRDAVTVVETDDEDDTDEVPTRGVARGSVTARLGDLRRPVVAALEREDDGPGMSFMDLYAPGILLVGGLLLSWIMWFKWTGGFAAGLVAILIATGIQVLLLGPLLMASLLKSAEWFGLGFGTLYGMIYRVAAVTLGAGAVCDVAYAYMMVNMDFGVWAILSGFPIYIIGTGVPMALFFDMDPMAASVNGAFAMMPRAAILFTAGGVLTGSLPVV